MVWRLLEWFVEWIAWQLGLRSLFAILPDWMKWSLAILGLLAITVILPAFMYFRARKNAEQQSIR